MNKKILALAACFIFCIAFILFFEYQRIVRTGEPVSTESASSAISLPTEFPPKISESRSNPASPESSAESAPESVPEKKESPLVSLFFPIQDDQPANEELQTYIPGQCAFEDDTIILTAAEQNGGYLSGKAESILAFRYGTFSFEISTTRGTGLFPAIWMLPSHGESYPEIDIYELVGNSPHQLYGVLHYDSGTERTRDFFTHEFPEDAVPDSVTLDFEWTPEKMVWYVDGNLVYTIDHNIPDVPMYMIFNLAVGGHWPGAPNAETQFPAEVRFKVLEYKPQKTFTR